MQLFLVFTPLHALLAYALAATSPHRGAGDLLILGGSVATSKAVTEVFSKVFPGISFRVLALESTAEKSNLRRSLIKKRNLKKLQETVEPLVDSVEDFYYVGEWHLYTTWLSHLFRTKANPPGFHLLDDGIGIYSSQELRGKGFLDRVLDRLIYGFWHVNCRRVGSLNEGASLELLFPELLAPFYPEDLLNKIDPQPLRASLDFSGLPQETAAGLDGLAPELLIALDGLGFRPLSSYGDAVRRRVALALEAGKRVAVKLHPGDVGVSGILDQVDPAGQVAALPAFLPIEFYYLYFQRSLKEVLGGLSSSLMTARWLLPELRVGALCSRGGGRGSRAFPPLQGLFGPGDRFGALRIAQKKVHPHWLGKDLFRFGSALQILATPLSRAAWATALATAGPTRLSKALGMM